jgi:isoamylase
MQGGEIDVDEYGEPIIADHILMLFNADHELTIPFTLPATPDDQPWRLLFDAAHDLRQQEEEQETPTQAESTYPLEPCSMAVFHAIAERDEGGVG